MTQPPDPLVKSALRICAKNLYGWSCEVEGVSEVVEDWDIYPDSWPRTIREKLPLGIVSINDDIRQSAERGMTRVRSDLVNAGPHYPREEVREALLYWCLNAEDVA
jgi:hypothetical protein